jgi:hypothetical protein
VYGKTGKRKRSACQRDNDEIPFEPDRKVRKSFKLLMYKKAAEEAVLLTALYTDRLQAVAVLLTALHTDRLKDHRKLRSVTTGVTN